MVIMNMILISMGVFFAVFDSLTMTFDMAKNINKITQFMRGTITKSRAKMEKHLERKVYYFTVLLLFITQGLMMINMTLATQQQGNILLARIILATLVLFIYTSMRNIVLISTRTSQKVLDIAIKFIAIDTIIILVVNIGQLICVGTFLSCLVNNIPVNVLVTK